MADTLQGTIPRHCHKCDGLETPEWRRGPDGPGTLCNECGLRGSQAVSVVRFISRLISLPEYRRLVRKPAVDGMNAHSFGGDRRCLEPVEHPMPSDDSSRPDPAPRTLRRKEKLGLTLGTPAKNVSSEAIKRTSPISDEVLATSALRAPRELPTNREKENNLQWLHPVKYQDGKTQLSSPADSTFAKANKPTGSLDHYALGQDENENQPPSIRDKPSLPSPVLVSHQGRLCPPTVLPFTALSDISAVADEEDHHFDGSSVPDTYKRQESPEAKSIEMRITEHDETSGMGEQMKLERASIAELEKFKGMNGGTLLKHHRKSSGRPPSPKPRYSSSFGAQSYKTEARELPNIRNSEVESRMQEMQRREGAAVAAIMMMKKDNKKKKEVVEDEKCGGYETGDSDSSLTVEADHTPEPDANTCTGVIANAMPNPFEAEEYPSRSPLPGYSGIPHFISHQSYSILRDISDNYPGLLPEAVKSESLLEDGKQTQDDPKIKRRFEADIEMTSDEDEDGDMDGEQEGIDEKEAERVVHELLGKYTTLYD